MEGVSLEPLNIKKESNKEELKNFLSAFQLDFDEDIDYTIVCRIKGEIVATASTAGNILKCFAISEAYRNRGILEALNSKLMDRLFQKGIYHYFIFTTPEKFKAFSSMGYNLVYQAEKVVLLEHGIYTIEERLLAIAESYNIEDNLNRVVLVIYPNFLKEEIVEEIKALEVKFSEVLVFLSEEFFEQISGYFSEDDLKVKFIKEFDYFFSYEVFPRYFIRNEEERKQAYKQISLGIIEKYIFKLIKFKMIYFYEGISKWN